MKIKLDGMEIAEKAVEKARKEESIEKLELIASIAQTFLISLYIETKLRGRNSAGSPQKYYNQLINYLNSGQIKNDGEHNVGLLAS